MIRKAINLGLIGLGVTSFSVGVVSYFRLIDWMPYDNGVQVLRIFIVRGHVEVFWFDLGDLAWARENMIPLGEEKAFARWQTGIRRTDAPWVPKSAIKGHPFFIHRDPGITVQSKSRERSGERKEFYHRTLIGFPVWVFPTLFLAPPAFALYRGPWRRWRRRRKGMCISCGYDLRGSDSDECPECATVFDPQSNSVQVGNACERS